MRYETKLSVGARVLLFGAVILTMLLSIYAAGVAFESHLANKKAAGFFIDSLAAHKAVTFMLVAQSAVIFILYALYFWIVAILARRRGEVRHWAESDWVVLPAVWSALSWWVLRLHSIEFPHSVWSWLVLPLQEPVAAHAIDVSAALILAWRVTIVAGAWLSSSVWKRRGGALAAIVGSVLSVAMLWPSNQSLGEGGQRSVVIIGLDSIRRDMLLTATETDLPNIAAMREVSFVNSNVVTPLARTFPSWVTILTGLSPMESGARTNHAPQKLVRRDESMAWDFRRAGFRTIFATDETRFSHIVPEFGFDSVIGPQMGITDFLLGQLGDQPLVNFFVQIPFAEHLLPALTANRAFAHAYRPESFVERLSRGLGKSDGRPVFLAVHLCTAHWPFFVAKPGVGSPGSPLPDRSYREMAVILDAQLGQLLEMLRMQGYLNANSLLVVLADHGEGLSVDGAQALVDGPLDDTPEVMGVATGHGATLLGPDQWQVFTMFSGASVRGQIRPEVSDALASLQDVAPTVLRLAGIAEGSRLLEAEASARMGPRDYVQIETGWRPRGFDVGTPDGSAALRIAASSYNLLADGRIEMREDVFRDAVLAKDYGVTDGQNTVAVVTLRSSRILVSREAGARYWTRVDPAGDAPTGDVNRLLRAACLWAEFREAASESCELYSADQ